ncbi:MAG TPA: ABC transporter permease [Firmicutes bacterium]|nr:ABC transporter permease [Bacillota bacterium]
MFKESVRISWFNIVQNKMRSFLTVLGIIIGVMSIITLVSVVEGVTGELNSQFTALGANKIIVQTRQTLYKTGLSLTNLDEISEISGIAGVSPSLSVTTSVVANQAVYEDITIEGRNDVYFKHRDYELKSGRVILPLDVLQQTSVAIISDSVSQKLFGNADPIGQFIQINGIRYTVVGVLEESDSQDMTMSMMGSQADDVVYLPITSALKLMGMNAINSFDIYMEEDADVDTLNDELSLKLNQFYNYDEDSFSIMNMDSLMDTMKEMQNMMLLMLIGITSISLLVGGIGIMNMMLVSVTERTTEIGLRKALGAKPRSIQLQFLLESAILSLFGGVVGIILGVVISLLIISLIGISPSISVFSIILALTFSLSVGIVFGFAPAKKASQLNPIDALRSA